MDLSKRDKQKLLIILGPTATGKSDLAVFLAKRFNGEVISADSRQVYKGMNLGTGKITKKEMEGIPHHLLDIVQPKTKFNVEKFKKLAQKKIKEIADRGHLPILAGGTGFWIDALLFNHNFPNVPENKKLRDALAKLSAEKLFSKLKKLNPQQAENIDPKNKVRLIRAIEIASTKHQLKPLSDEIAYDALLIGLDLPTEDLYKKIDLRIEKRLRQGMIKEVSKLHHAGVSWKRLESFGLEYKFIALFLQKKIATETEMQKLLAYAIKHYAKRQRTWFKRHKNIHWLSPGTNPADKKDCLRQSSMLVKNWL